MLHVLAIALNRLLGGRAPVFEFVKEMLSQPLTIPVILALYLIQAGLEELGWRGYMLDRVQRTENPSIASVILGICHALWHLPLFWMEGTNQKTWGFGLDLLLFVATVVGASFYASWCYNDNGRSTLAVTLLHFTGNVNLDVFSAPGMQQRIYHGLVALGAVVIAAVWAIQDRSRPQPRSQVCLDNGSVAQ
jgi:membrane protease YdiL (CAAX protease family)